MQYVFGILMLISTSAFAGDWICEEESSQRRGNILITCGIGTGYLEDTARYYAFKNAKYEFESLCRMSSDCQGAQKIIVSPGRTTCKKIEDKYHCVRMLSFEIEQ